MKFGSTCCLIMIFFATTKLPALAGDNKIYRQWIAYYEQHDPAADAKQNLDAGKIYVLSAMGVGQFYPGIDHEVGQKIEAKYGVKHLKDTSDASTGDVHMKYLLAAQKYATAYNRKTAKLLKIPLKQRPTTK